MRSTKRPYNKNIFLRLGWAAVNWHMHLWLRERKSQDETTKIFNCISMQADHANILKVTFEEV